VYTVQANFSKEADWLSHLSLKNISTAREKTA